MHQTIEKQPAGMKTMSAIPYFLFLGLTLILPVLQIGTHADEFMFRFSSKYFDGETKLYYYGYRFYSPSLGRWLSKDLIQEEGGFNLYEWLVNAPTLWYDALGHLSCSDLPSFKFQDGYTGSWEDVAGAPVIKFDSTVEQYTPKYTEKTDEYDMHGWKKIMPKAWLEKKAAALHADYETRVAKGAIGHESTCSGKAEASFGLKKWKEESTA